MLTERQLLTTQVVLVLALVVIVISIATQSSGLLLGSVVAAVGAITMLVLNAIDERRRL
ncbi:putative membrane protein [Frigoribacterium sp. PvP054]|uniref:hypothetical protein n=1 Tax=Frigoribacterium sp. PvP054 TaxID=3156438 RepID=UPI00339385D7